jgi:hypothetical protein
MSGFLLDTNCISELVRSQPEPRVLEWMEAADESLLYLSVLTLGEIRKGVAGLPQGKLAFQEGFCPLMRPSLTDGVLWQLRPSVRERLCRPSTVCWPRLRFTTTSPSFPAM